MLALLREIPNSGRNTLVVTRTRVVAKQAAEVPFTMEPYVGTVTFCGLQSTPSSQPQQEQIGSHAVSVFSFMEYESNIPYALNYDEASIGFVDVLVNRNLNRVLDLEPAVHWFRCGVTRTLGSTILLSAAVTCHLFDLETFFLALKAFGR